eukprot:10610012-Alexandrium_andersonii.AAC.1
MHAQTRVQASKDAHAQAGALAFLTANGCAAQYNECQASLCGKPGTEGAIWLQAAATKCK